MPAVSLKCRYLDERYGGSLGNLSERDVVGPKIVLAQSPYRGVQLARQQNYFRTTTKPISARYLHLVPTKKFVSNCSCTESCSTYRQPRHNLRASAFNQIRILLQLHLPHSVHRGHRRISTNESSFDIHFAASTAAASAASTAN